MELKNIVNKPKFWIITACVIVLITAGVILISNLKEELPIVLDSNSISKIEYFDSHEMVLESGKDDSQINEFVKLFNQSKRYTDDVGTTHPLMIRVILNDDSIINIWWGTQGFITVGDEKTQFNIQNYELEDFLSELLSDNKFLSSDEKTAVKGLELYVWTNPEITGNDDIYYTLLQGTNRKKEQSEIYNLDKAAKDLEDINEKLSQYRNDTQVVVLLASPVDNADAGKEVREPIDMQAVMDKIEFPVDRQELQTTELVKDNGEDIELEEHINDLIEIIMSSPKEASATFVYINTHKQEYDEIVGMECKALAYLTSVLESNDYGLRGNIVYQLCTKITSDMADKKDSLNDEQKVLLENALSATSEWKKDAA